MSGADNCFEEKQSGEGTESDGSANVDGLVRDASAGSCCFSRSLRKVRERGLGLSDLGQ